MGASRAVKATSEVFGMDDEGWRRHANPWSVFTRLGSVYIIALAIWSRTWIGWWSLLPIGAMAVWMWLNTRVFAPVGPDMWAAKGIYAERMWANKEVAVRRDHQVVLRLLIALGLGGMALTAWGLVTLELWPTAAGSNLVVLAQLWRIDRMVWLHETVSREGGPGESRVDDAAR